MTAWAQSPGLKLCVEWVRTMGTKKPRLRENRGFWGLNCHWRDGFLLLTIGHQVSAV